jgi:protein phosphatase
VIALRAGAATHPGRVRERNEDAHLVGDGLFAVCDGVGGHRGGEVAAATAIETLRSQFVERSAAGLLAAIHAANRRVWERSLEDPTLRGMATTLAAAALVTDDGEERIALANVGDSRAYVFRDGELTQVSEDHSLVEELVREGRLSREEADLHPQRSLITRALGLEPDVVIDHWDVIPYAGDRILLCTDGLTNEVPDDRIAAVLRRLADPEEAARELVRLAVAAGGRDNVTVVVVDVVDDGGRGEAASAALADEPLTADASAPAPAGEREGGAPAGGGEGAAAPAPGRRPSWARVAAFFLALAAVVGTALGAVGWYARKAWFVGATDGHVGIYRGRPGGLLWFRPTLVTDTGIPLSAVAEVFADDVRAGKPFADRAGAERYLTRITIPSTTTTTTTTTAPPTTAGRGP